MEPDDAFELYDLRVEVVRRPGSESVCGHVEGEAFSMYGPAVSARMAP